MHNNEDPENYDQGIHPASNTTPTSVMQTMSETLYNHLINNDSLDNITQEALDKGISVADYLNVLLLLEDSRLPRSVIIYRKFLGESREPLASASPERLTFIESVDTNLKNISGDIKRRVLKRQSTRGKKASRIKPKRQNGSKKRKGVKTRYVQGKKKKKKMNKKSSQKQNKK